MNHDRISIRLKPDTKSLIQQAAELRNQTVTQFVVATICEHAGKVLAEHRQTILSNRDRDMFLKALDQPPKPNDALKAAKAVYRKRRHQQHLA